MTGSLPTIVLYTKPGCELCRETRGWLESLLDQRFADGRPRPIIKERDVSANPAWERAFGGSIPVVEVAGRRFELATSPTRLRTFLAEALDAEAFNSAPSPA